MSYNTPGVSRLNSFEQAVAKFKNTKPIRGKKGNGRVPLGIRRYHHMASISMPDEDTVNLMLYDKPLITWRSDNTFTVQLPNWCTAFTVPNIIHFLPTLMWFSWDKGRLLVVDDKNNRFVVNEKPLKFRVTSDSIELINPPQEYAIRKKRHAEKPYMDAVKPFFEWAELVMSIADKDSDKDEEEWQPAYDKLFRATGLMTSAEFEAIWTNHYIKDHEYKHPAIPEGRSMWDERQSRRHIPHGSRMRWRGTRHGGFNRPSCEVLMNWITSPLNENWVDALHILSEKVGYRESTFGSHGRKVVWSFVVDPKEMRNYVKELVLFLNFEKCFELEPLEFGQISTMHNMMYQREISCYM